MAGRGAVLVWLLCFSIGAGHRHHRSEAASASRARTDPSYSEAEPMASTTRNSGIRLGESVRGLANYRYEWNGRELVMRHRTNGQEFVFVRE